MTGIGVGGTRLGWRPEDREGMFARHSSAFLMHGEDVEPAIRGLEAALEALRLRRFGLQELSSSAVHTLAEKFRVPGLPPWDRGPPPPPGAGGTSV